MSDILIKNMKMPRSCYQCFYFASGCSCNKHRTGRPQDCPLVEVATPHGRLIDAGALLESIKEARKKDPEIEDVYIDDYFMVAEWVVSSPTIIESEGT